jgi:hypothetical protein
VAWDSCTGSWISIGYDLRFDHSHETGPSPGYAVHLVREKCACDFLVKLTLITILL